MGQACVGLLDILAVKVGCMYFSDLHTVPLYLIQHTLRSLQPKAFSLREWNDAVSYLTGTDGTFQVQGQAKEYLLNYRIMN